MSIDLPTLVMIQSLIGMLQVMILYVQQQMNHRRSGLALLTWGSLLVALGFVFDDQSKAPVVGALAAAANNTFLITGMVLIYSGAVRFLERPRLYTRRLFIFALAVTLVGIFFTYATDQFALRRTSISLGIALISFLLARGVYQPVEAPLRTSANFVAFVFALFGIFLTILGMLPYTGDTIGDPASEAFIHTATCLGVIIFSTLWTFGFINMVNQRANVESLETTAYLDSLLNYANAPIVVWDGQFRITRFNHAFELLTGHAEAEVLGRSLEMLFPPEVAQDSLALIRKTHDGERWETVEIKTQHRDGSVRTVLWNSATLFSPDGRIPLATIAQGQDITGRKQVEDALRESEEKHRVLFRESPDAYFILADGNYVDCNRAASEQLRAERAAILNRTPVDFSPPCQPDGRESETASRQALEGALRTGGATLEWVFQRADGTQFFSEIAISSIYLEGKPALFVTCRDISERKQAEQTLLEHAENLQAINRQIETAIAQANDLAAQAVAAESELRRSKDQFNLLLQSTDQGIYGIDLQGKCTFMNAAGLKTIGYALEEVADRELHAAIHYRRADGSAYPLEECPILGCKDTGRVCRVSDEVYWRKDGTPVPVEYATHAMVENGRIVGAVVSFADITERKRAEQALQESEQRYRLLADYANDVIWTMGLDGRFTFVSPSMEQLRGFTPEEVYGQTIYDTVCPGSCGAAELAFAQIYSEIQDRLRSPTAYFELELTCKDGSTVWTEASARVMYNAAHHPVGIVGVSRDITERKHLQEKLEWQAATDALTGVNNRRRFMDLAPIEVKRSHRLRHPLAMVLIDIDLFKNINDTHGHAVGDLALRLVAQVALHNIREIDIFGRLGGDEFGLMMPATNVAQAQEVIQRICTALAKDVLLADGARLELTLSAGVASLAGEGDSLDRLLERADRALYQAKAEGRNRVVVNMSFA